MTSIGSALNLNSDLLRKDGEVMGRSDARPGLRLLSVKLSSSLPSCS